MHQATTRVFDGVAGPGQAKAATAARPAACPGAAR
jgi:hypothetical protein